MEKFYFNRAMGTTGAVTGKPYHIRAGQTVEAPADEFRHVDPASYEQEKAKAAPVSRFDAQKADAEKPAKKAGRPRKKTQAPE